MGLGAATRAACLAALVGGCLFEPPGLGDKADGGSADRSGSKDVGGSDGGPRDSAVDSDADLDAGGDACVARQVIVGDGVDQDCDGVEECFRDLDEDGFGGESLVPDTDLDCSNASASTSSVSTDCDDQLATVFPGTTCSDGELCTANDLCVAGECLGHTVTGTCAANCSPACPAPPGGCCTDTCPGGACPTCEAGTSCVFECTGSTCEATCAAGSTCHVDHSANDDATTGVTCESGASCEVECTTRGEENDLDCTLDCRAGAYCLMSNCEATGEDSTETCNLVCAGTTTDCGAGVLVCDRACP